MRLVKLKIFISWSGQLSRGVGLALREWLPLVVHTAEPYLSAADIDKGARWSADISRELESSHYGILCVTAGNIAAPWLNFEAGALSRSFDKARVSPFLFGISRSEVTGPLLQFQSTVYERADVLKLVSSINASADQPLDQLRLPKVFDRWWPDLKAALDALRDTAVDDAPAPVDRSPEDMLAEVLDLVRSQQKWLTEGRLPSPAGYAAPRYPDDPRRVPWVVTRTAADDRVDLRPDQDPSGGPSSFDDASPGAPPGG
jgi:hypothetical protein